MQLRGASSQGGASSSTWLEKAKGKGKLRAAPKGTPKTVLKEVAVGSVKAKKGLTAKTSVIPQVQSAEDDAVFSDDSAIPTQELPEDPLSPSDEEEEEPDVVLSPAPRSGKRSHEVGTDLAALAQRQAAKRQRNQLLASASRDNDLFSTPPRSTSEISDAFDKNGETNVTSVRDGALADVLEKINKRYLAFSMF